MKMVREATANYTVSDDGAGHLTTTRNDTESLNGAISFNEGWLQDQRWYSNGNVLENHGSEQLTMRQFQLIHHQLLPIPKKLKNIG